MNSDTILFKQSGSVATITLNRPESRNALTFQMISDLGDALQSCATGEIRAVLLTGAGDAFCAGADLKGLVARLESDGPQALSEEIGQVAGTLHKRVVLPLLRLKKPVVGAINGVAAGAGFSLMLACDLRIASNGARFLMAYGNIGATADGGSTYLLPRIVGSAKAMELYLASQPLGAESALEMGLVTQICDKEALAQHALETAMRLAQGATVAYGRVKELFLNSWSSSVEDQLEAETKAFMDISLTRDLQEGVKAFTEKRPPWFQGL